MPRINYYLKPNGDRFLEFWKSGRGGERKEFVWVPSEWSDDEIKEELEGWGSEHFQDSDYVRYGWNDKEDFGSRK